MAAQLMPCLSQFQTELHICNFIYQMTNYTIGYSLWLWESAIDFPISNDCDFTGNTHRETVKNHVLLLIQINYLYIVWNNVPKFHENSASSFWAMCLNMCVIVVSLWGTTLGVGAHKLDRYPFRKIRKSKEQYQF